MNKITSIELTDDNQYIIKHDNGIDIFKKKNIIRVQILVNILSSFNWWFQLIDVITFLILGFLLLILINNAWISVPIIIGLFYKFSEILTQAVENFFVNFYSPRIVIYESGNRHSYFYQPDKYNICQIFYHKNITINTINGVNKCFSFIGKMLRGIFFPFITFLIYFTLDNYDRKLVVIFFKALFSLIIDGLSAGYDLRQIKLSEIEVYMGVIHPLRYLSD